MILEKDASVLGYPGETSKALDADHHNVCKYDGPHDPNYILVRNVLKSLMSKAISSSGVADVTNVSNKRQSHDLKSLLAMTELPDIDYIFFRDRWAEGTNQWILDDDKYLTWFNPASTSSRSSILWLNGGPGTGKSVLSSFIINDIITRRLCCQYFFIRTGDQKKRSLSLLLRCLAYQLSRTVPEFLKLALDVADEGIDFETADARTIWERLFKSILFRLQEIPEPLYWIIDGVDEAADPRSIFKQFSDISLSSLNIRILLVSRRTSEMSGAFNRIQSQLNPNTISIEGHFEDIRCYVHNELSAITSAESLEDIVQRIVDGSENNFLVGDFICMLQRFLLIWCQWVRLAVEKISSCHSEEDIDEALQQLPLGMEALYDRMASSITQHENPRDRNLAIAILQCVTSSLRTLTIPQLCLALNEDTSRILDIQKSVVDLCAGFVVIDNSANVVMVHQTAREYLLHGDGDQPVHVQEDLSHGRLFLSCMRSLMTVGLRAKVQNKQTSDFLDYAATCWSKHLTAMPYDFEPAIEALSKFLSGSWILIWIHYLSSTKQLGVLVQAAGHLSRHFATQRIHQEFSDRLEGTGLRKRALLEGWATDLIKIVGKFGRILRRSPDSIYKIIPPFCPQNSSVFQTFGKQDTKALSVLGMTSDSWDDSIAYIPVESFTVAIRTAGSCIAILAGAGTAMSVFLYDSSSFEMLQSSPIKHKERVQRLELNSTGTTLATYGYRTTKVWDTSDGSCKLSVENSKAGLTPLAMHFINNTTQLLIGTDDRCLRLLDLTEEQHSWGTVAEFEEEEIEGHFLNAASFMTLNREATLIAVAYRGHPLSAWEVDGPELLGHCYRTREGHTFDQILDAAWNPHYEELLGLYYEGTLFRWRPYDEECEELSVGASKLSISKDGNLIATGDGRGTVKIFTTADLALIYHVTAEEGVFGLAFGPDSRRIYDIRGYHCNAWEPNALIKFAAQSGRGMDSSSDTESLTPSSTDAVVSRSGRIDSVTVLAASPQGRFFSYGTDRGDVVLYDSRTSIPSTIFTARNLSIEHLQWSDDGRNLAVSYSGKRVIMISFRLSNLPGSDGKGEPSTDHQLEIPLKMAGNNALVSQLLFDKSSKHLAVFCSKSVQVISLSDPNDTKLLQFNAPVERKWLAHPDEEGFMIGVATSSIMILDWQLTGHQVDTFEYPPPQSTQGQAPTLVDKVDTAETSQGSSWPITATQGDRHVERAIVTKGRKKHLLVQLSLHGSASRANLYLAFDMLWFSTSSFLQRVVKSTDSSIHEQHLQTLTPTHFVPSEIANDVALVLDFFSHDRLVYLSRDFSICIWQVPVENYVAVARNSALSTSSSTRPPSNPSLLSSHQSRIGRQVSIPGDSSRNFVMTADRPRLSIRGQSNGNVRGNGDSAATTSASSTTNPRTLFYLPGDWISRISSNAVLLWSEEKSLLCPRNGEVAMVRCSALA